MKLGLCIGLFFLYLTGCRLILEQEWGPNLAQEATSLEPNLIDGNLGTKAVIPEEQTMAFEYVYADDMSTASIIGKTVFGFILAGQCITKGTFNPPSYNSPLKPFKG